MSQSSKKKEILLKQIEILEIKKSSLEEQIQIIKEKIERIDAFRD